ncbi:synaptotagmin-like protein 4 isoform X5 [Asterias rubens]|uniref:synaptotagmin-like protein 4 isoform X5 n=1 Tax=Asterias rubens TaxID=7604 RepID=UPI001455CCFE|nr:synaptotagmin-like protein 4 isoform X5 [Asterias rubens]
MSSDGQDLPHHQSSGSIGQMVPQRLSPSLIDLEHLSPEERSIILSVLDRDEQLRSYEQDRVKRRARKLKGELHDLRKKSAAKESDENDNCRVCVRCREPLGRVFKSGDNCPKCQHRVCTNCQVTLPSGTRWLCTVCHKSMQLQLETGEWYYKKLQVDEVPLLGSDLVKASLAKAKQTLTDPTTAPVLTASDLRSKGSLNRGKGNRGRKQRGRVNSQSSSDYASSTTRESSRPSVRYENSSSDPNSPVISHTTSSSGVGHYTDLNSDPEDLPRGGAGIRWRKAAVVNQAGNRLIRHKGDGKASTLKPDSHLRNNSSLSATDSSEVDAVVVEPITGFTFQRVSFRRDRGKSDNTSKDSADQGSASDEMGCMQCVEQDSSCLPAGLPEDDQDYYIEAKHNKPVTDINTEVKDQGPVISVEVVDDGDGEEEDIDHHFMVHAGLTPELRRKFGMNDDAKFDADTAASLTLNAASAKNEIPEIEVTPEQKDSVQSDEAMSMTSSSPPASSSTPAQSTSTLISPDDASSPRPLSAASSYAKSSRSVSQTSVSSLQRKLETSSNLSKGSSVSMTSLYSQAGEENYGKYVITGDIRFGLNYNYKTNVFEVKVKACRDLAPVDVKKIKSDPYVKTYLLPDKTKASKRKTFVRKGTVNPQFDMTLRYHISQSELETRTLSVTVWNNDAFGRNDFLGEVLVSMDSVKLDDYKLKWHQLCNKSQPAEGAVAYKGDLTIAMMYTDVNTQEVDEKDPKKKKKKDKKEKKFFKGHQSPEGGALHLKIKEARNLVGVRMGGSSNPFVKCYLEPDRSKSGKHKTAVIRGTCNPRWDDVIKFENVSLRSLKNRCLELTVWDHETLSSNEFLGGTRLNLGTGEYQNKPASWNDAKGQEIKAWEDMMKKPNHWTETTLVLRPNMVSQLQFT